MRSISRNAIIFASMMLSSVFEAAADSSSRDHLSAAEVASSTTIVSYKNTDFTASEMEQEAKRLEKVCNCNVESLPFIGAFILKNTQTGAARTIGYYLDSAKEIAEEDQVVELYDSVSTAPSPNDPDFGKQWALLDLPNDADINAQEGWAEYLSDEQGKNPNGPPVVVAVLDTGVDYNHPDLKDMMWRNPEEIPNNGIDDDGNGIIDDVYGANFVDPEVATGNPMDDNGHGTHCAGIIDATSNNGKGIAGLAGPANGKVKILACKVFGRYGFWRKTSYSSVLRCINYAISMGAKILSNSWGGPWSESWITTLKKNRDHLFVFAAGNSHSEIKEHDKIGCGTKQPNLLCVASSEANDQKAPYSDYGKEFVHVFAPGTNIYSTYLDPRYDSLEGTSMACPFVAGLAALMVTMRDDLNAAQIKSIIEKNVNWKPQYRFLVSSGGLIDVQKTMRALKVGGIDA